VGGRTSCDKAPAALNTTAMQQIRRHRLHTHRHSRVHTTPIFGLGRSTGSKESYGLTDWSVGIGLSTELALNGNTSILKASGFCRIYRSWAYVALRDSIRGHLTLASVVVKWLSMGRMCPQATSDLVTTCCAVVVLTE
jgi:hypothetical protein